MIVAQLVKAVGRLLAELEITPQKAPAAGVRTGPCCYRAVEEGRVLKLKKRAQSECADKSYCPSRVCLRTFFMKVRVQRPCVLSWLAISTISRAFVSSASPALALTSLASCTPSAVVGPLGPAATTTAARWCESLVFVTSWNPGDDSARRPEPWQLGHLVELPPSALPMRPSPPHMRQGSSFMVTSTGQSFLLGPNGALAWREL